ncbi:DUF4129 domain-containing protein [Psychromicrobium sp. YIM B11713]|uniref:DUF4129 domain-containing protein n=1 Tax=Psychromicrobium sp. YIM B11713 TaxID=3145233 RepID=UPI00374EE877
MRIFDVPVDPDAEQARQWAIEELAKRQYQEAKPGLGQQILEAISKFFSNLLGGLSDATHIDSGVVGIILVVVPLLVIGLVIYLVRPRLLTRQQADAEVFETDSSLSAQDHRARAQGAAKTGDFSLAVTELFRAIVRSAEERVVIDPQPGRTADEVTGKLAAAFAQEQQALWQAALLFNRIRYSVQKSGRATATEAAYQELLRLDESLQELKPAADDVQLEWVGPR